MKKISTAAAREIRKVEGQRLTIGGLAHPVATIPSARVPCPCLSRFWKAGRGISPGSGSSQRLPARQEMNFRPLDAFHAAAPCL